MQINIEPRRAYLLVKAGGHVARVQEVEEAFLKVFRASLEENLPKILLDAREVTTGLSAVDRYEFAIFVAKEIFKQIVLKKARMPHIAVVLLEDVYNSVKFGEIVARNMGIVFKITDSVDGALNWLGEGTLENRLVGGVRS